MRVFISWSGTQSHRLALILRDWLPSVIQALQPYVSSEDIDKGARWSTDISKELEQASFGLLCVTRDNIDAPWLNFEAGALSKFFDNSKVSPILLALKRSEVRGPLLQFQSTLCEKEDFHKLLKSLNKACDGHILDEKRLDGIFEVWWPALERDLAELQTTESLENKEAPRDKKQRSVAPGESAILEEVLELLRNQHKLLKTPEAILPPGYLMGILRDGRLLDTNHRVFNDILLAWELLQQELLTTEAQSVVLPPGVRDALQELARPLTYLKRHPARRGIVARFDSRGGTNDPAA